MMSELFDEEYQRNQYDIAVKRESQAKGRAEERNVNINNSIAALKPVLKSLEAVANVIKNSFGLTKSEAAEKVTAYWNLV